MIGRRTVKFLCGRSSRIHLAWFGLAGIVAALPAFVPALRLA